VCRKCDVEYGTTRVALYPGRGEHETLPERFHPNR
jgi:hypothetical protein